MNQTLIIGKKDAEELLTMEACIRAMEETFRDISAGKTTMLQRSMMPQKKGNMFALMASDNQQQEICGVKTIVFPGAEAKKNGTSQGIIPLFDSATGALLAIVDAEHITALRTAAASAAATRVLAREDSCTLGLLGAGRIGRMHIAAISQVRPIRRVFVWNRTPASGEVCCKWVKEQLGLEAVSYTHLDVYKRQVWAAGRWAFPGCWPACYGVSPLWVSPSACNALNSLGWPCSPLARKWSTEAAPCPFCAIWYGSSSAACPWPWYLREPGCFTASPLSAFPSGFSASSWPSWL